MSYKTVAYAVKDHIARLTLDRPAAKNAINQELLQEVAEVCQTINGDDGIYAVLVTGAGDAFCSGSEAEAYQLSGQCKAAEAIASINRPVIAAINGDALGEGLEIALSCDIRLASAKARFGLPQIEKGAIPSDGGTQRLPRIVGRGKALELILTGDIIDTREALEIGLINEVVEADKLMQTAEALAQAIASKGPIALRFVKEAVNKGLDLTLEQGLRLEADLYFLLHTTADRTEGINAFQQKRQPQFEGK